MNHDNLSDLFEIATEWSYEKYSKKETGYTREYWMAYKLAELIVRECAAYIFVLDAEPVSHKSAARMLMEHFGVEE